MKKGLFAATAVVSLLLCGCGKSGSSFSRPDGSAWTLETLTSSMTLCGQTLSYPITLDGLGSDFSIDENNIEDHYTGTVVHLRYKGEDACNLRFECAPDKLNGSVPASMLIFCPGEADKWKLSVNGFTAEDQLEDAKDKLGEPSEIRGATYYYRTMDNGRLDIIEGTGGKIFAINLYDMAHIGSEQSS